MREITYLVLVEFLSLHFSKSFTKMTKARSKQVFFARPIYGEVWEFWATTLRFVICEENWKEMMAVVAVVVVVVMRRAGSGLRVKTTTTTKGRRCLTWKVMSTTTKSRHCGWCSTTCRCVCAYVCVCVCVCMARVLLACFCLSFCICGGLMSAFIIALVREMWHVNK